MRTKFFKSGNSLALRIPAALATPEPNGEVEITRNGDTFMIRPVKASMAETIERLRKMPKPEPMGPIERTQVRRTLWDRD